VTLLGDAAHPDGARARGNTNGAGQAGWTLKGSPFAEDAFTRVRQVPWRRSSRATTGTCAPGADRCRSSYEPDQNASDADPPARSYERCGRGQWPFPVDK